MNAVIDIGSNSVLLLVGERQSDGSVHVHMDRATITRLSEGAAATGVLASVAVDRTLGCLQLYAEAVRELGVSLRAVATEGVRMAGNSADFLAAAHAVLGRPVETLSGEEEARLSYLSVALETPTSDELRVLDIGGASTELVVGRGRTILSRRSHPVGSVRLTEAHVRHDPILSSELAAVERASRAAFETQPLPAYRELVGVAGTATTAAAVMLNLEAYDREAIDGARFPRARVLALRDELAAQTVDARARRPCIGPGRADVIVTGLTLLVCALDHCGAESLLVRDRGLRYALL